MMLGVMEGHEEDDRCSCGHTAISHSPCCGACMVCGTRVCDEFQEIITKELDKLARSR